MLKVEVCVWPKLLLLLKHALKCGKNRESSVHCVTNGSSLSFYKEKTLWKRSIYTATAIVHLTASTMGICGSECMVARSFQQCLYHKSAVHSQLQSCLKVVPVILQGEITNSSVSFFCDMHLWVDYGIIMSRDSFKSIFMSKWTRVGKHTRLGLAWG